MEDNELCGLFGDDPVRGTYTTEGITKLCEGLKGSAVTSLKCAAAPRVFALVSAPTDTHLPSHSAPTHPLAVSSITASDWRAGGPNRRSMTP